ncbi:GntR family transcriptional regulator [Streptosporangium sp. KLBMP 9127]|nr:GntR family transcriptional regulator [Streptosporangium sp. KLBMP 9127]
MRSRPPTVQEFVLEELRRAVVSGELKPGQPIRQEAIAADLGVSRVPLREALKILEGEGQVVHRPHRGYMVAELSLPDLLEVYRIREILEPEAVRSAVEKLTDTDIERIIAAQHDVEMSSAQGDLQAMTVANRRFHFAIIDACQMSRLVRIIRNLWNATDAYRSVYYNSAGNRERVEHEHRGIVEAVLRRDAEQLIQALAEHRAHAVDALSAIFEPAVEG